MKLLLDCKAVSHLLSAGLDEDLPVPDRARLRLHLVMCQNCRNVDEQLAFLRSALQALGREQPDGSGQGNPPHQHG